MKVCYYLWTIPKLQVCQIRYTYIFHIHIYKWDRTLFIAFYHSVLMFKLKLWYLRFDNILKNNIGHSRYMLCVFKNKQVMISFIYVYIAYYSTRCCCCLAHSVLSLLVQAAFSDNIFIVSFVLLLWIDAYKYISIYANKTINFLHSHALISVCYCSLQIYFWVHKRS